MRNWKTDEGIIVDADEVKAVSDELGVLIDGTWIKLSPNGIEKVKNAICTNNSRVEQAKSVLDTDETNSI